ncbi:LCP family protein [Cohnella lubricantis]|nr:LCP family protein [Cohnella lubricantis]MBP2119491.1 LCP family protein required for cell wall assembly [Cohnella lubricantis]
MQSRSESRAKKKKRLRWWHWVLYSVLGVAVIALCFTAWYVYSGFQQLDDMSKPSDESRFSQFTEDPEVAPPEWTGTERVNILLMGGDDRGLKEGEVARSDSMMVASFDPVTKDAHLFSVLRDTYAPIPGHGSSRINAAITMGGPELAMKTIGNMTGLDIQYYVYVDFQGFIKLVDAIGGVDFYVEKDMNYSSKADKNQYDIHLEKGQQHLDGEKALMYVRFRHDAMSDFTRTERQRAFLKAVADKLQSGWNIVRLPDILSKVTPYIETNLQPNDMLKLASLGFKSHQAGSAQLPPMNLLKDMKVGGDSVLGITNEEKLKDYVQEVLGKDETETPSSSASASPSAADSE